MIIRQATLQDTEGLLPLMEQLGYPQTLVSFEQQLARCLDSHIYFFLIAELNSKTVGLAAVTIYPSCYKAANRCVLEVLVVDAAHQRQGIGTALIKAVEDLVAAHKCSSVSLLSNQHRLRETHSFYAKRGYANEGPQAQLYLRKAITN